MREEMLIASPQAGGTRGWKKWHFGAVSLDERTLELIVRGEEVALERKPLSVLIFLLNHAGEVCTKDELLEGVWSGRVLSETVLTKCIGRLREVLHDEEQTVIKTAYGFGYRLVVPVRVELVSAVEPARFGFKTGDHPPGRPLWSLVDRLGTGGQGEAWRAQHEKTHEYRVFKFALDEGSFGALKREITLFRVINDSLGDSAKILKLVDWNLEHQPFFIESEYAAGGSLIEWARARGGLAAIPLADRIEVIAKIASALAAVHLVGVLHKDLKPSNVLVRNVGGDSIDVVLADFGSGGVLDHEHFEKLGITRLGFTKTLAISAQGSGTPMYLAPEILHGQPFTVKSDIYALGVMLYQFVAGDPNAMLSAGWERHIDDELLRVDIAALVEGNPALRLADADVIANRLRTLTQRHEKLAAEREEQSRAEHARRMLDRARARRVGLVTAIVVLVVGLGVSTTLYWRAETERMRATAAAARANAVVEFLGKDVFAPASEGKDPAKDLDLLTLLNRAGAKVDVQFVNQPDIASRVHFVIGRSFTSVYEAPSAMKHLNRALELGEDLQGDGSEPALLSAAELIRIDQALGKLRETMPRYERTLVAGRSRLSPAAPAVRELELRLAQGAGQLGRWQESARRFETLLASTEAAPDTSEDFLGRARFQYGTVLNELVDSHRAREQLTQAVRLLTKVHGPEHELVGEARAALGRAFADSGLFEESELHLVAAQELVSRWAPPEAWVHARPRIYRGLLLLHMDRPAEAAVFLGNWVKFQDDNWETYVASLGGLPPNVDHTAYVRQALGEAYARQGKLSLAIETLRRAVDVGVRSEGETHPVVFASRLSLAESLLDAGRDTAEAAALLEQSPVEALRTLPPDHPILAQRLRVSGLLARSQQDVTSAGASLRQSLAAYEKSYGPGHWKVRRARAELAALK